MFLDDCTGFVQNWLGRHGVDVIPVALVRKLFFRLFLCLLSGTWLLASYLVLAFGESGLAPLLFRGLLVDFPHYSRYSKDIV
jgi:hypothetical protein